MSILCIDKLSRLCIYNTSTYDIEKPKFPLHKGNFIKMYNFINAVIHNNNLCHIFHIKD